MRGTGVPSDPPRWRTPDPLVRSVAAATSIQLSYGRVGSHPTVKGRGEEERLIPNPQELLMHPHAPDALRNLRDQISEAIAVGDIAGSSVGKK